MRRQAVRRALCGVALKYDDTSSILSYHTLSIKYPPNFIAARIYPAYPLRNAGTAVRSNVFVLSGSSPVPMTEKLQADVTPCR